MLIYIANAEMPSSVRNCKSFEIKLVWTGNDNQSVTGIQWHRREVWSKLCSCMHRAYVLSVEQSERRCQNNVGVDRKELSDTINRRKQITKNCIMEAAEFAERQRRQFELYLLSRRSQFKSKMATPRVSQLQHKRHKNNLQHMKVKLASDVLKCTERGRPVSDLTEAFRTDCRPRHRNTGMPVNVALP